jgi:hypothetical protein
MVAGKTGKLDRAVLSVDGATTDFFRFDMEFLGRVANRIVNEVRGINRVVCDVTAKPPASEPPGPHRVGCFAPPVGRHRIAFRIDGS